MYKKPKIRRQFFLKCKKSGNSLMTRFPMNMSTSFFQSSFQAMALAIYCTTNKSIKALGRVVLFSLMQKWFQKPDDKESPNLN